MESKIVFAALLIVVLLLLLAVYDTSPSVRKFLGRVFRLGRGGKEGDVEQTEVAPEEADMQDKADKKRKRLFSLRLPNPLRILRRRQPKNEVEIEDASVAEEAAPDPLEMLTKAVGDLSNRVGQMEPALAKIGQLEGALAKVSEDTQIISEDMKDVLGSLRASIDGLERRIEQVSGQVANVAGKGGEDGDSEGKIKQLEEVIGNLKAAVEALPAEIEGAEVNIRGLSERLESMAMDIQGTLGYGIQKSYRCDSCGTEGFVASHVVCSKCGTGSMWGWWPPGEEPVDTGLDMAPSNRLI